MADFLPLCLWVIKQEDATMLGETVNLNDGQGLTRYGIAMHANPALPPVFYTEPAAAALNTAVAWYKKNYWNRFQGDSILSDQVASCLLSFAINDGTSREVKMLQACLGVPEDGIMGPVTLTHTNAYSDTILAPALRAAQADYYRAVVASQPTDVRFLKGWLKRASLIYPSLE